MKKPFLLLILVAPLFSQCYKISKKTLINIQSMSQQMIHKKSPPASSKTPSLPVICAAPTLATLTLISLGWLSRNRTTETIVLSLCIAHPIFALALGVGIVVTELKSPLRLEFLEKVWNLLLRLHEEFDQVRGNVTVLVSVQRCGKAFVTNARSAACRIC
jgi:hypothetical protein